MSFVVSTLNDSGLGSLRDAIDLADISGTTSSITFSIGGTIILLSSLPQITVLITIDGNKTITIDGNNLYPLLNFNVALNELVTITNLTLINGSSNNSCALNNIKQCKFTTKKCINRKLQFILHKLNFLWRNNLLQ